MSEKKTKLTQSQTSSNHEETGNESNQKKSIKPKTVVSKVGRKRDEEVFQNPHVLKNITEKKTKGLYYCKLCPKSEFLFKYIRKHLTSTAHRENANGDPGFKELLAILEKEKIAPEDEQKNNLENFLAFVKLGVSLSLSSRQISKLAKRLKELYFPGKLGFFLKNDFNESNISDAINSFGEFYLECVKDDLAHSKFSLAIDNSTITKTNICAIKVKYLKDKKENGDNQIPRINIENKIIALKYLKNTSSGQTLFNILQEKVFSFGEKVKNNFIGITFDHAKAMTGQKKWVNRSFEKGVQRKIYF